MKTNILHRRIASFSAVFLVISAVTGLVWAYAPHIFFKDGYLKKKQYVKAPSFTTIKATEKEVIQKAGLFFHSYDKIVSITLKPEASKLVYLVVKQDDKKTQSLLFDALSGKMLSPIDEKFAIEIAAQYVPKGSVFKLSDAIDIYTHRKGRKVNNVYRVVFTGSETIEIFIDRHSGEIIEESSPSRRFLFLMQKLHQLEFFGTKKELTAIPGISLLILAITGVMILWRRYTRNRE
ncbi:MAG TPA: PepSY domain-containing protein [Turneriella sp.]|nr:PepSY domain-containing protein [Turneriella sp.]